MSHITPADVRCISHVEYEENIDSGTFLTPWREKKNTSPSRRRRICVCVARSERRCSDKINLRPTTNMDIDVPFGYTCRKLRATKVLTRLTKRMLLSMLEKELFIVFIRFHLFMRRFRREFASQLKKKKKKKKYTQCRNERWHERFAADKCAVRFNCQYAPLHR